jgi:hypothetical protein
MSSPISTILKSFDQRKATAQRQSRLSDAKVKPVIQAIERRLAVSAARQSERAASLKQSDVAYRLDLLLRVARANIQTPSDIPATIRKIEDLSIAGGADYTITLNDLRQQKIDCLA